MQQAGLSDPPLRKYEREPHVNMEPLCGLAQNSTVRSPTHSWCTIISVHFVQPYSLSSLRSLGKPSHLYGASISMECTRVKRRYAMTSTYTSTKYAMYTDRKTFRLTDRQADRRVDVSASTVAPSQTSRTSRREVSST